MKIINIVLSILLLQSVVWGGPRSSQWNSVRKAHLAKNPVCAICGTTKSLQVHHIKPFHKYPELELDPNNLITLCTSRYPGYSCHFEVGHGANFRYENPWLLDDIKILKELIFTYKGYTVLPKEIENYLKFIKQAVKEYNLEK
jgi:hypothetical protein